MMDRKPGVLQSIGLQRVGHYRMTELTGAEFIFSYGVKELSISP